MRKAPPTAGPQPAPVAGTATAADLRLDPSRAAVRDAGSAEAGTTSRHEPPPAVDQPRGADGGPDEDDAAAAVGVAGPLPTPSEDDPPASPSGDTAITVPAFEIPLNPRVLNFVELYTGRLRGFPEESLRRGARYLPMIQQALTAEGLPADLAFVPIVESAFNPSATSRAKARGLWQFMRGTAVENGLRHDWYVDERAEPERATLAAARYLKTLHDMFGDWHLALASYNGGPGRVQRAMKRSGKTDFWALTASRRFLPRETRDYVPLILAATIVSRNPEHYGLTVSLPEADEPPDTIAVTSPVDLRRLADAIDHPVDELRALNPGLRRWATPPDAEVYNVRIPPGTASRAAEFLASIDAEQDSPDRWHMTKKGDTIATVAKKLKVTRRDLLDANFLKTGARLRPGQRLVVPKDPASLQARVSRPAGTTLAAVNPSATPPAALPAAVVRSAARRTGAPAAAGPVVHRVKRGETLGSIARRYRTSEDEIRRWNSIPGTAITAGQRLKIRPRAEG